MRIVQDDDGTAWTCIDFGMPASFRQEGERGQVFVRVLVHCRDNRHFSVLAPPEWEREWSDEDVLNAIRHATRQSQHNYPEPEDRPAP